MKRIVILGALAALSAPSFASADATKVDAATKNYIDVTIAAGDKVLDDRITRTTVTQDVERKKLAIRLDDRITRNAVTQDVARKKLALRTDAAIAGNAALINLSREELSKKIDEGAAISNENFSVTTQLINEEASARASGDAALSTKIDNSVKAASAFAKKTDGYLDYLDDEVDDLTKTIGVIATDGSDKTVSSYIHDNEVAVNNEVAARKAAIAAQAKVSHRNTVLVEQEKADRIKGDAQTLREAQLYADTGIARQAAKQAKRDALQDQRIDKNAADIKQLGGIVAGVGAQAAIPQAPLMTGEFAVGMGGYTDAMDNDAVAIQLQTKPIDNLSANVGVSGAPEDMSNTWQVSAGVAYKF